MLVRTISPLWKMIEEYKSLKFVNEIYKNFLCLKHNNFYINKKNKLIKLSQFINQEGYPTVRIQKNKHRKYFTIHRLIGRVFIINKENKSQINHKDGNKKNNILSNLEWVTQSENQKHAFKIGLNKSNMKNKTGKLHPNSKSVLQLKDNKIIKVWESVNLAIEKLNLHRTNVYTAIKNNWKCYGYYWRYE